MPPKKKGNEENKLSRYGKWTEDKYQLFAIKLAEEENSIAVRLGKLALRFSTTKILPILRRKRRKN